MVGPGSLPRADNLLRALTPLRDACRGFPAPTMLLPTIRLRLLLLVSRCDCDPRELFIPDRVGLGDKVHVNIAERQS
jgi:hypothetical protein